MEIAGLLSQHLSCVVKSGIVASMAWPTLLKKIICDGFFQKMAQLAQP